ncbi:MAG: spondin domain-containing protein [Bacteroidota bacterium]
MNKWKTMFAAGLLGFGLVACKTETPQATTASFEVRIENLLQAKTFASKGTFGLLQPGETATADFQAGPGDYLSFATMFVQSNDLFYGFDDTGLALYDQDGNAVTGDVTGAVDLWDSGTEVNEEPGVGLNQAPRQSGPDTGPAENAQVQLLANVGDGFNYPSDESVIRVSLAHDGATGFTLTIENISASSNLPSPLAPGLWAIHPSGVKLFTDGEVSSPGIEALAEDGNNAILDEAITPETGYFSPFAPGVFAIHTADQVIFADGQADFGEGLEVLAEDGDPASLNDAISVKEGVSAYGIFNTPEGASAPGPLLENGVYTFTFDAEDGDYLSFATMLVQTNDLFYGFGENGLPLFRNGEAISGDYTAEVDLWDAGTEVNEYPGAGPNQPIRGGGNSGDAENGTVSIVNDGFTYPSVTESFRITIIKK